MRPAIPNSRFISSVLILMLAVSPCGVGAQEPEQAGAENPGQEQGTGEQEEARRVRRLGDISSDDYEMDMAAPPSAPGPATQGPGVLDLPDEEQNSQLQKLLSNLAVRPGNREALGALDAFLDGVLEQAGELAGQGELDRAQHLLSVVRNVNPHKSGLAGALKKLEDLRNIGEWLLAASQALDAGRIIEPEGSSAMHFLRRVEEVDPGNQAAEEGLLRAQGQLIDRALDAARELDFESAEEWLYEASTVRQEQDLVAAAEARIADYQAQQAGQLRRNIRQAIEDKDFDLAEFLLIDLIALEGNNGQVRELREELSSARVYGRYAPGQVITDPFTDGKGNAPPVVVIKAGSFLMGSPESERERGDSEGPQHRVTLEHGFAIGQHEVTVAEFRAFIQWTRHRTRADLDGNSRVYDERSGRIAEKENVNWSRDFEGKKAGDNDPVLHVDWYDAQAYVVWLTERTGKSYRLPTEAEFEYALRGGTVTRYWWGDDRPEKAVENLTGVEDQSPMGRYWTSGFRRYGDGFWGPAPVGVFEPNPLGLYDMAGNVSEWTEDCWHQNYIRAPADGSAWINPGCERRVVRGGYWAGAPDQARSAARISAGPELHGPRVGFRVARDL